MRKVSQVIQSGMCTGCGFCAGQSGQMGMDGQGFLRPVTYSEDLLSQGVCPGLHVAHHNVHAPYHRLWGPLLRCDVGYANDPVVRLRGATGGLLTALLIHLLNSKRVDAVIQVGVSTDNPIRNHTYVHHHADDVLRCAGSRYSPSAPLSVVRSLLGNGMRYAIVGKPCDIAAMRALLADCDEYRTQFPYLLSFMCAGVPSEEGTNAILRQWGVTPDQLISFRYRGEGWPGLTKAITTTGTEHTMTYNESWGTILNRHLQARCKLCADGIGEAADIVCGDAWYASSNGTPCFDEQAGRSLTIVRTEQGRQLLEQAVVAQAIVLEPDEPSKLQLIQPYQANRKQTAQVRRWAVMFMGGKVPQYRGYHLGRLLCTTPLKITLKAFIGSLARKLRGRI